MKWIMLFILYIFTKLLTKAVGSTCFSYDSTVHKGRYLSKYVYRQVDVITVFDCASLCKRSTVCKSFNFDTDHRSCHLNTVGSDVVTVEDIPGFLFSDITDWPENIAGPCKDKVCNTETICTVDRLNQAKCEPEFPGCGSPPTFPSSSSIYDGHYLGSVASYTCNTSYIPCNTSCLTTGQWDAINAACVRDKWEDVSSPLDDYISCENTDHFSFTMRATPTTKDAVRINFMKGSDHLLHVVLNYPTEPYENHLMKIDAEIDGTWSGAVNHKPVEVLINQQFTVEIHLNGGTYTVLVDGVEIDTYSEKKPGVSPDKLTVGSNGLQIHHLEIQGC